MKNPKFQKTTNGENSAEFLEKPAPEQFLVVGIGASAGGIQALKGFFENVPVDSGIAYVVILHLSPNHESHLAEILQTVAAIPVTQVTSQIKVEPNHVYVVPPNQHLQMHDGQLTVTPNVSVEERRAPIDIFFRTLAESHQASAVAVILSGTGANGSMGLKRIKERGGAVFVQNPREAEFSEMPRNSIATELIDQILNVEQIPARIIAYKESRGKIEIPVEAEQRPEDTQQALREIFTHLRLRTGHDFSNYKRPTVLRRIERRINVFNLPDLSSYAAFVRDNYEEANALLKDLLISVTNFFRDGEAFDYLEHEILPKIFHNKTSDDQVRIWVCGCATGEEAYSVAMLCAEQTAGVIGAPTVQIFATDIDEPALTTARAGFYTLNDAADVSPERLRRFFLKENDGYRIRHDLREMILFANQNVMKDPPFSRLDVVTCRNLLIYLNATAQERVMETFHFALNPGGFLFLGNSESVDGAGDLYAAVNKEHHLFQSRQASARIAYPVPEISRRFFNTIEFFPVRDASPTTNDPAEADAGDARDNYHRTLPRISFGDLHQQLLEQYAPPSVVVNEEYDIVHLSQRAGRYLQITGGEPTKNLLKMIRPELRLEVRTALYQAVQNQKNIEIKNLKVRIGTDVEVINIYARPVLQTSQDTARGFILVVFEPTTDANAAEIAETVSASAEPIARQLEEELVHTKSLLRRTAEQFEVQTEELKASNEELQAMNEELRSAAEELETSKEELQSVNEELITVNQELKIKIDELAASNNDFQNLINSTDIATIFLDRAFKVKSFTPAASRIFNLIAADEGRSLSDITNNIGMDDLPDMAEKVLNNLQAVEREVRSIGGRTFLMRVLPYRTAEDRINGVVITFTDITRHKQAEEELRLSEERLQRSMNIETVGVIYCNKDIEITDCNEAFLRMVGFTRDEIRAGRYGWEVFTPAEFMEPTRRAIDELNTRGFTTPYEKECIRKDGSRFWALFSGRRISDSESVEFITDITKQKRAQESLRESETRLRALIENLPGGAVFVVDQNLRYLVAEGEALAAAGFAPEDLIGKTIFEALPEELASAYEPHFRQALAGKAFEHEHTAHGRCYISRGIPLRPFDGEIYAVLAVSYDISERKQAEEALRESERRFRSVFSSNMAAMGGWTKDGGIFDANDALLELIGYSRAELEAGQIKWNDITSPEFSHLDEQALREIAASGTCTPFEKEYIRKDGTRIPVLIGGGNFDEAGESGIFFAIDLTEHKRAEQALRESEERMRLALQASQGATWDLDVLTGTTIWSPSHFEMLGYPSQENGTATFDMWSSTVHEDDRQRVLQAWRDAKSKQKPYEAEYRIRRVNTDEISWLSALGQFFYDEKGEAIRSVGVVFDITGRKQTEQELAAQRRLYKSITDNATTALFIMDERQQCVFMNPAAELLTGYTMDEALGRVLHDLVHHIHPDGSPYPLSECPIDQAFPTRNQMQGEEIFVHKDGHLYNVAFTASPLLGESDTTIGTVIEVQDITERKWAEGRLRESEERYGLATQAVKAVIYDWNITEDKIIRSQQLEQMLGFAPDEKEIQTNAWWKSRLHPEDAKRAVRLVREAIKSAATRFEDEYRIQHRDGHYVWVSDSGVFLRDEQGKAVRCVGSVTNITKRKEAEESLRESEERTRIAVEASELATWKWDLVKQEVWWNREHFLLFGMEPHSNPVVPKEFFRHVHPDDREYVTASLEKSLREKTPYDEDFRVVLESGETRWMSGYGRVVAEDAKGNPTQMSGVMFDITERKQIEQALKDADRRKDEFLATLAHELRNPLAPIRVGLEIMRRRKSQELGTEARQVIERQVTQIIHLVDDLLDMSRISQGKITLQKERIALTDFINMALETNHPSLIAAKHEMIVNLPSSPIYVNGDLTRLTQIVLNLLNNAVKYTEPGGTIQLSATAENQHVTICVKDSGIGIPAQMLPRIFDVFTQVEHSSKQMQGGLGIGLSLVKTLVEMHGGTIEAISEGIGSEFVVRLPIATEPQPPDLLHEPEAETVSVARQNVLVVDDNVDALNMMEVILTMQGHDVVTAFDGTSAIEIALAQRPTVAVLDIGLPDLSGYEVAQKIRQHLPNILLIALSGWGRPEDRTKSRAAGFDLHLVKPVDPEQLQTLFQERL
jgi:two-component system, chemotaxis family, CheB/CheR fusion protein